MVIVNRDVELMGWILEQKFMTTRQIRKVFWKGAEERTTEGCRRVCELARAGYLKRSGRSFYREVLYMVTGKGVKVLRAYSRDGGLNELAEVDHSNYKHDSVVTDLRILFHELGYTGWLSERVLSSWKDLRKLPDGMLQVNGRYFAIEYEASRKAKFRYHELFIDYEMDRLVDAVIYVVEDSSLIKKIRMEASTCTKPYFISFQDLTQKKLDAELHGGEISLLLRELLAARR